jgi:hypothetical protein
MLLCSKVASWRNLAKTPDVFNLEANGECVTSVILRRLTHWYSYFVKRLDGFWNLCGRSCGSESIDEMRTAFFWAITQRIVVISYRRFGTTCRSQLQWS